MVLKRRTKGLTFEVCGAEQPICAARSESNAYVCKEETQLQLFKACGRFLLIFSNILITYWVIRSKPHLSGRAGTVPEHAADTRTKPVCRRSPMFYTQSRRDHSARGGHSDDEEVRSSAEIEYYLANVRNLITIAHRRRHESPKYLFHPASCNMQIFARKMRLQ